jgi:hydroxymethylglutaryl-CoA reductase
MERRESEQSTAPSRDAASPHEGALIPSMRAPGTPRASRLAGLHLDGIEARRRRVEEASALAQHRLDQIDEGLSRQQADGMVENVVGVFELPLAIATNFTIDGRDVLVPMAVEEPSVVAAASNGALRVRAGGGFRTDVDESMTVAQVELRDVPCVDSAIASISSVRDDIIDLANRSMPELVELGGGARELELRPLGDDATLVVHLVVDCLDAMGANAVNTMAEAVGPLLADLAGARIGLRILTNLADRRLARAWCMVPVSALARRCTPGEVVRDGVVAACRFAEADPYRAATHNKGIMNGIDAAVIATGNDWRAVEAGAHAWAARDGRYGPLTRWRATPSGDLEGRIELPLALGTVGGAARVHPTARLAREILGVERARDLARIVAAVGLAQNLAALSALATEGIQEGHMALHARSVALCAGALSDELEPLVARLREGGPITTTRARELLAALRRAS